MQAFNAFLDKLVTEIVDPILTLLAVAAFLVFVWGMMNFIRNADNDEKRIEGKSHMLWGIVGLAIIFGAVAIVNFLKSSVGAEG